MAQALELASRGEGFVEPNPMVGCVLEKDGQLIGEGWHEQFGGPHAEVMALKMALNSSTTETSGATAYVTLKPCSHQGKTPPCCQALIDANIARVVVAHPDPNPQVGGNGIRRLQENGVQVEVGLLQDQAARILAPYLKRIQTGIPWIIGKWAMTLDGKIATSTGDSKWISNEKSRAIGHRLRGRVDAILVGSGTALADDPLLTARPAGPRLATRIVMDSQASLPTDSKFCQSAIEFPTLVAVGPNANPEKVAHLREAGCEVWCGASDNPNDRLIELLRELPKREMTNVLIEGGSRLLGSLNDLNQIDEVHVFLGPKLIGGSSLYSPIGGTGQDLIANSKQIEIELVRQLDDDVYIVGRTK